VPNVMMVIEVEEDAFTVFLAGFSGRNAPIRFDLQEEVDSASPRDKHENNESERNKLDSFATAKLHDDVKGKVEEQVADENGDQIRCEVVH